MCQSGTVMAAGIAQRKPFHDDQTAAVPAAIQSQLIPSGERQGQKYRVLEGDLRGRDQSPISFKGVAASFTLGRVDCRTSHWHSKSSVPTGRQKSFHLPVDRK